VLRVLTATSFKVNLRHVNIFFKSISPGGLHFEPQRLYIARLRVFSDLQKLDFAFSHSDADRNEKGCGIAEKEGF
jgi:hypothetical protein